MRITSGTWNGFVDADRQDSGPLHIDLARLTWAPPVVIAGVAAQAHRATSQGRQVSFTAPEASDVSAYLSRMHLGKALDDLGVMHDLPKVNERDQKGNLVELRRFSSEADGEELGGIVHDRLRDMSHVNGQVAEAMHEALIEIATNTAIHAEVTHGYAIAQTYPGKNEIVFAVADGGIGLMESLSRNENHKPVDDGNAIELAVIRNVSGFSDANRGYGLAQVVRDAAEFGGRVEIASGGASAVHTIASEDDAVTTASYTRTLSTPYNGVIVQASIPWEPTR